MIRPVNDFRIGNLVLDEDGELCKIEQLSSEKMECFQQVSNIENKSCISAKYPSNIYAIELTEEWLLKFGAIKYEFEHKASQYRIDNMLFIIRENAFFDYGTGVKLQYVHQLQNLYFALYGEELGFSSTEP